MVWFEVYHADFTDAHVLQMAKEAFVLRRWASKCLCIPFPMTDRDMKTTFQSKVFFYKEPRHLQKRDKGEQNNTMFSIFPLIIHACKTNKLTISPRMNAGAYSCMLAQKNPRPFLSLL